MSAKSRWAEQQPFVGKSAIITGGSQGIGLAAAKEFVRLGGSVCIVAIGSLDEARDEVVPLCRDATQSVETLLCDTTDMEKLKPLIEDYIERRGLPGYLFNFVGYAHAQYVEKLTLGDFKRNMHVNYYGQLVPTLIMLPHYLAGRRGGYIVFTSSVLGYMGTMGYATYSPTKHAIVGLAETLRHELKPFGITVSVLYPPDTRTPGFDKENEAKPPECAIISGTVGLLTPDQVAESFIGGILGKTFQILPGKAKRFWRLFRYFPGVVRVLIDSDYAKARKELGKV